jgi:uncharacterized membrane protein YhaH (DUF805 family)
VGLSVGFHRGGRRSAFSLGETNEMNVPSRYSCDPPWWIAAWNLCAALALVALAAIHWIRTGPGLVVAGLLMLLVILVAVRKLIIRRFLQLEENALLLPTGFLQLRSVRIAYDTILDVAEARWALGTVLYIRTSQGKYEIPCGIRINRNDYVAVRDYLVAKTANNPNHELP